MKTNRRYFTNLTGFNDLLFLLIFTFLFMLIVMLKPITETKKKSEVEPKAEFLITLEWEKNSDGDVDLWAQGPGNDIVFFRSRESGNMHLDRDDLGTSTDTIMIDGETQIINLNRETITIRGIAPGWYIINIHYYRSSGEKSLQTTVNVIKINPYQSVQISEILLIDQGEEHTIIRFKLDKEGKIIEKNYLSKKLFSIATGNSSTF